MQQIERQSGEDQKYQTPPKKDKGRIKLLKSITNEVPQYVDSSINKSLFVFTPSTGQPTSNYNKTLARDHYLSKNQSFNGINSSSQKGQSKQKVSVNLQNSNDKIKIRLFQQHTANKNKNGIEPIRVQQNDLSASRFKSKSKKGLSLLKNLIVESPSKSSITQEKPFQKKLFKQEPKLIFQQDQSLQDQVLSQLSPVKHLDFFLKFIERQVQVCYCKHFLIKIYGKVVRAWKVNRLNFGKIMFQEGLISDLVKERHLVQKIWFQICELIGDPNAQNIKLRIVFAFFVSVMGYPIEEINLFNNLESIINKKIYLEFRLQQQVYNHFKSKKLMFNIKRLSTPKKL